MRPQMILYRFKRKVQVDEGDEVQVFHLFPHPLVFVAFEVLSTRPLISFSSGAPWLCVQAGRVSSSLSYPFCRGGRAS